VSTAARAPQTAKSYHSKPLATQPATKALRAFVAGDDVLGTDRHKRSSGHEQPELTGTSRKRVDRDTASIDSVSAESSTMAVPSGRTGLSRA
jgi:hypothetical protein